MESYRRTADTLLLALDVKVAHRLLNLQQNLVILNLWNWKLESVR